VTADRLEGAVFRGGAGTDTLILSGGGIFDPTFATLSSIETVRGTSRQDTIYLDSRTLAGIKTLSGGGGSDILQLAGSNAFDFRGKSIGGFSQIEVVSKTFSGTFSNKALALLVNAKESQNDTLRLVGGSFSQAEITQQHRQGVDTIIDDNGTYTNAAPDIRHLSGERVYTSGGRAFLDRGADATLSNLDNKLSSLEVTFEDIEMRPGRIAVADDYMVTVPDGLIDGGRIMFDGIVFGTLGVLESGLRFDFTPDVTAEMAEALLHSLVFEHTDPDPSIRTLPIDIELADEGGRTRSVYGEVLSGDADIRIFDVKHDGSWEPPAMTSLPPMFMGSLRAIFIDAGRNAILSEDDQLLRSLTASVEGGTATDILGVATTETVQVLEMTGGNLRIYVNGINIGFIALTPAGAPELSIQFNEKATPDRVQEVIRALTYKDMTGTATTARDITITVTDYTYHSTSVAVSVEQELNQRPTDMALDLAPALELAANGTIVGVLSATDPNAGLNETFSYTLLNDAGGRFVLNGNVLKVKQGTKLDYEQASSHEITVRVTDKLGLTLDKTFTIDLTDVANEMAVGTTGRDIFVGGERDDRIYGKLGNDVLTGGFGKDVFVFDTALNRSTNVDTIKDFSVKDDTIWLENAVFRKLTRTGILNKDFFTIGTAAKDKNDYIVYDNKTGALYYDADGSGSGAAIKFAQLAKNLKMTNADFLVV